jgi:DNA-binding protein HU-beta
MIKIDIANALMQTLPVSKATALQVVDLLTDRMKKALLDGDRIEIRGFGVFEPRPRKRGMGRNIKTGQSVEIPKGKQGPARHRRRVGNREWRECAAR